MEFQDKTVPAWYAAGLQLFDSALPSGAYAHSQGLEGLVQEGWLLDTGEVEFFIRNELAHTLVHCDLPVVREAHRAVARGMYQEIQHMDELAEALKPTRELRLCGSRIGKQTWRLYGEMFPRDSPSSRQHSRCTEFLVNFQSPVIFGLLAGIIGMPEEAALCGYSQQAVTIIAQVCIKLLRSGPTETQRMILGATSLVPDWVKESMSVTLERTGSAIPVWDIASARHQFAEQRLFIS